MDAENIFETIKKLSGEKEINYKYLDNFSPDGKAVSDLTLKRYNESPETYIDYNKTIPFYTRKSDAEIAKLKK